MDKIYKINDKCRLCSSIKIIKIVSIGESPVSEKYLESKNFSPKDILVPLDLYMCEDCGCVQLIHVVNPDYLWKNFTFKTSRNPKFQDHYETYALNVIKFAKFTDKQFILDIGSNDGTLLKIFKDNGFKKILGIDPVKEIAEEATNNGIQTIPEYMNIKNSKFIKDKFGIPNLITANNVFAHIDDMDEITDSIVSILDKNGLFVFEISYLLDVIEKKLLGTIFHEHLSYYSLNTLKIYLNKKNMEIVEVLRTDLQGGSLICYVQHKEGSHQVSENVIKLLDLEDSKKLNKLSTMNNFSEALNNLKFEINDKINFLLKKKSIIAGYGSARSATTLIKFFDIGEKIQFIVDDNEYKHYKFTPGSRIEVLPSEEIHIKKPNYLILFAWEHADKIIEKNQLFIQNGGAFIKIFPNIEIIKK